MPPNEKRSSRFVSVRKILPVLLLSLTLSACNLPWFDGEEQDLQHDMTRSDWEYLRMDDSIEPDAEMKAFIEPYREELFREMNLVIAISNGVIERGQPESPLGNLTADILRNRASREMGKEVDIAILNRGGLRVPIPEGEVTVGHMYELMPFENHITLLRFTGSQIRQLANELAIEGGEPVSGLRMRIDGDQARDLLVGNMSVQDSREYWVATNNWMADGGGPLPTLWSPLERVDVEVLLRDAFIEYLRHQPEPLEPRTDNRIRK